MISNLVTAVFWRELKAIPRRRRFYMTRSSFLGVFALVILGGYYSGASSRSTTMGLQVFAALSMTALVFACLSSTATTAGLISRERQERTLGLLFLTDITGWEFLTGKLWIGMFSTLMSLLMLLPLFILAVSLGGVSTAQILLAYLLIVANILLGSSMGLFSGAVGKTERMTNGLIATLWGAYYGGVPLLLGAYFLLAEIRKWPKLDEELFLYVSPFAGMGSLIAGVPPAPVLINSIVALALSLPLLFAAHRILPRRITTTDAPPLLERIRDRLRGIPNARRWVVPEAITGNPVAWKDLHYLHGGRRGSWMKYAISTAIIVGILFFFWRAAKGDLDDLGWMLLISLLIYSALVFLFGSVNGFGQCFLRERRNRSMELLLTTDLTDEEIIAGKAMAVVRSLFPWLATGLLCTVILCVAVTTTSRTRVVNDFWMAVPGFVIKYVTTWFGYSALAMWISLRYQKSMAMAVGFTVACLWHSMALPMVVLVVSKLDVFSYADGTLAVYLLVLFDASVSVGMGLLFLSWIRHSFRALALKDPV